MVGLWITFALYSPMLFPCSKVRQPRTLFVVAFKRCQREVPTGLTEFPFRSVTVECCLAERSGGICLPSYSLGSQTIWWPTRREPGGVNGGNEESDSNGKAVRKDTAREQVATIALPDRTTFQDPPAITPAGSC